MELGTFGWMIMWCSGRGYGHDCYGNQTKKAITPAGGDSYFYEYLQVNQQMCRSLAYSRF